MNVSKERSMLNFKKAQSHIAKIMKMVEEDAYCIDIMQQNLAVIGLLRSAQQMLMEGHLNSCFLEAMATEDDEKKQRMIAEILTVSRWANK
ncbi:MAG: metal-sensitive transcriptional regulator [Candidatus Geothermincolia bacterium]